ncbi:hypothetical protein ERJ75_000426100 [Trypanosoma vivax]|nr:hypothetical protein TRVL_04949 [Trypanosoma vivax]KAH8617017.1 hypothetical protein ERJ75_000426100 [Trypanosoma vivax]
MVQTSSGRSWGLTPPPPKRAPRRNSNVCRVPTWRWRCSEEISQPDCALPRRRSPDKFPRPVIGDFPVGQQPVRMPLAKSFDSSSRERALETATPPVEQSNGTQTTMTQLGGMCYLDSAPSNSGHGDARQKRCEHAMSDDPSYMKSTVQHSRHRRVEDVLGTRRQLARSELVGTELMPSMPCLQGTRYSAIDRSKATLECFLMAQPVQSQPGMLFLMEEYKGRELELCDVLNTAYRRSWDAAVLGLSTNNGDEDPSSSSDLQEDALCAKRKDIQENLAVEMGKSTTLLRYDSVFHASSGGLHALAHLPTTQSTQASLSEQQFVSDSRDLCGIVVHSADLATSDKRGQESGTEAENSAPYFPHGSSDESSDFMVKRVEPAEPGVPEMMSGPQKV